MEIVKILMLFTCVSSFFILTCGDAPCIEWKSGILQGVKRTTKNNVDMYTYLGIPYAVPPINELRFQDPIKHHPGMLPRRFLATEQKDPCVQSVQTLVRTEKVIGSEDCLYLNIYTPSLPLAEIGTKPVPVMVWMHGGGFFEGDNSYQLYAPDRFVEEGIVVVTVAYRLGAFGFMSTEDLNCPGNMGLKDQHLALQWVKDNIKFFGGDSSNIILWGESAGAITSTHLLAVRGIGELISGAIIESGSSILIVSVGRNQKKMAVKTGELLGIANSTNTGYLISELRKVDAYTLQAFSQRAGIMVSFESPFDTYPYTVVIEPKYKNALITEYPFMSLKKGKVARVPVLIGYNSLEGSGLPDAIVKIALKAADVNPLVLVPSNLNVNDPEKLMEIGTMIKEHYFSNLSCGYTDADFTNWFGVHHMVRPIVKTADLLSNITDCYLYRFDYAGYLGNPLRANFDGVGHAEELNYLFERMTSPKILPPQDSIVSKWMVKLWSNFVKYKNPTTMADPELQNVIWPKSKPYPNQAYLNIASNLSVGVNPNENDIAFWKGIFDKYWKPPFSVY